MHPAIALVKETLETYNYQDEDWCVMTQNLVIDAFKEGSELTDLFPLGEDREDLCNKRFRMLEKMDRSLVELLVERQTILYMAYKRAGLKLLPFMLEEAWWDGATIALMLADKALKVEE